MKKIMVLFLCTIFLAPLLILSGKEVKAEGINSFSYAGGKNLVDIDNLRYNSTSLELTTINKIYLENPSDGITIQLYDEKDDEDNPYLGAPTIVVKYYDIDGALVERKGMQVNSTGWSEKEISGHTVMVYKFKPTNTSRIFSFDFVIEEINNCYVNNNYPGFMIRPQSTTETYEEYIHSDGLFCDLTTSSPTIVTEFSNVLTEANLRSILKAYDGYEGNLSNLITIDMSSYTSHASTLGTYTINVSVEDSSGNSQNGPLSIRVVDTGSPVITGDATFNWPIFTDLTEANILSSFQASDLYDGDITSNLHINGSFTINSSEVKTEEIELYVVDSSGNRASLNVTISFFDNVPPVVTGPESMIMSYQVGTTIRNLISSNFSATDNCGVAPTMSIVQDEYTGHETTLGTYTVKIKYTDKYSNASEKTFTITIEDKTQPVIYLDKTTIVTLTSVTLEIEDLSQMLYSSGELKRGRKYSASVVKDTYSSHKNVPGNYMMTIRYVSDGDSLTKTFRINVTEGGYTVNVYAKKYDITLIVLISILSLLGLSLSTMGIIYGVKKRKRHTNA